MLERAPEEVSPEWQQEIERMQALHACHVDMQLKKKKQPGILPDVELSFNSIDEVHETYKECKLRKFGFRNLDWEFSKKINTCFLVIFLIFLVFFLIFLLSFLFFQIK
jgi:hypothetical protein